MDHFASTLHRSESSQNTKTIKFKTQLDGAIENALAKQTNRLEFHRIKRYVFDLMGTARIKIHMLFCK